jgi:hypothetical protein
MQRDEDKLQATLWNLLSLRRRPNVLCWAVNNNPRSVVDGARLKRMGCLAGIPDLHFLVDGQYQVVEIKTEKGRLTPVQSNWLAKVRDHGGLADFGRGWDECCELLVGRNLLLPGTYHRF